jgi:hypothetical protein
VQVAGCWQKGNAGRVTPVINFAMQDAAYYRQRAERVRQLARMSSDSVYEEMMRLARDFEDIADDLLHGAVEIRHPELMPQKSRSGR